VHILEAGSDLQAIISSVTFSRPSRPCAPVNQKLTMHPLTKN
jgi:hypothetical protein